MGLLEEREMAARARAEALREESERILAELAEAEAVLERRVIARAELAEALAAPAPDVPESATEPAKAETAPVAGSVVPPWHEGVSTDVLAVDYGHIVELVADEAAGGEGISAKELAVRLGLEAVPAKVEGVRSKAKRLAQRGWLEALPTGRFTPRPSTATARPSASGGPGGGS
ncbi:hypothetical protein ITI46_12280 [Streptomyces oryzae]|uniref:Uncharacterized protein n=2 Tax=Streptomyces oryzae TaxID=1434886 RepID=A0ABS3XAM1_9ACTN|nr:hypothetical protein [Streptomyces oryzae]